MTATPIQLDSGCVYWDETNNPPRPLVQAGLLNHALAMIEAAMEPEPEAEQDVEPEREP